LIQSMPPHLTSRRSILILSSHNIITKLLLLFSVIRNYCQKTIEIIILYI
jgi:hypothetical protein